MARTDDERKADRVAKFGEWIDEQRRKNAGADWARATEEEKLGEMYWESCSVSDGLTVPGPALLAAIERNIDYAGLPSVQRDMLKDLRGRLDAGQFSGSPAENSDAVGAALSGIVDAGFFEESLREARDSTDEPWSEIPEDRKVGRIIGMALDSGAWASWDYDGLTPGGHVLATIERDVDYGKLSPWRRQGLKSLRSQSDAGALDGESPICSDRGDSTGYALRVAELEAGIQDKKHFGATVERPVEIPWAELTEEEKLGSIERAIRYLSLGSDPKQLDVIAREVDLAAVPEHRRRAAERIGKDAWDNAGEFEELARRTKPEQGQKSGDQETAAAGLKKEWVKQVAFDRTVASLGRQWQEEKQGGAGRRGKNYRRMTKLLIWPGTRRSAASPSYSSLRQQQARSAGRPIRSRPMALGGCSSCIVRRWTVMATVPIRNAWAPPMSSAMTVMTSRRRM